MHRDLLVEKNGRLVRYAPETATPPKYYAFYRSAMWCPPCRAFTPDLVKFYKSQKRRDAPFELIFISSDRGEPAMIEYMEEYKMPWPAFPYDENKDIVERNGTGIPSLIVTDADGNKLLDSHDRSGNYIGPRSVMADLEDLLEKP